jgi:hypothetical protein
MHLLGRLVNEAMRQLGLPESIILDAMA